MAFLFRELARWTERHRGDRGRAAFVREGSALHFVGGSYKKPPRFLKAGAQQGPASTCKCAHAEASWAFRNPAWLANTQLNAAASRFPNVHVIPFYNLTLPRDDMHKGDMCSYRMKRVNGVATPQPGIAAAMAAGGVVGATPDRLGMPSLREHVADEAEAEGGGVGGGVGDADAGLRRLAALAEWEGDSAGAGPKGVEGDLDGPRRQQRRLAERRLAGIRPIRTCCDCLHMCYSPAFWDSSFFTPIYDALVREHGYVPAVSRITPHAGRL
jgi:hypothetical protein